MDTIFFDAAYKRSHFNFILCEHIFFRRENPDTPSILLILLLYSNYTDNNHPEIIVSRNDYQTYSCTRHLDSKNRK